MTLGKAPFPRVNRLKRASSFRALLKNAHSVRQRGTVLYYLEKNSSEENRLGVMVAKRVLRHATERNRVKRIVREFFRLNQKNFQGKFDLVIRLVENHNLLGKNELQELLHQLFKRAGIV